MSRCIKQDADCFNPERFGVLKHGRTGAKSSPHCACADLSVGRNQTNKRHSSDCHQSCCSCLNHLSCLTTHPRTNDYKPQCTSQAAYKDWLHVSHHTPTICFLMLQLAGQTKMSGKQMATPVVNPTSNKHARSAIKHIITSRHSLSNWNPAALTRDRYTAARLCRAVSLPARQWWR